MKAYAILPGLQIARGAGFHEIEMETDSLIVARALQGKHKIFNYASCFVKALLLFQTIPVLSLSTILVGTQIIYPMSLLGLSLALCMIEYGWRTHQTVSSLW